MKENSFMKKKIYYLVGFVFSIGLFLGAMSGCTSSSSSTSQPYSSQTSSNSNQEISGSEEDTSFVIEHHLETLEDGIYEIFEREVIEINNVED